ncbi:hypothetical protein N7452_004728 [Penicillium brevicompactum]|uniref:Poly [ADP-ribose] polymerase n=1 Tax=Penicillium brevicompactum TaxID=5074 RepID=A0A9W9UFV3_PENBR|nr:hypothetical protein N7452_004728 [Penicillium brevicompactum]
MPASFKNVIIAVSGTFPNLRQADVRGLVEQNGATFSTSVTEECTHLVTTQVDVDKQSTKYKKAHSLPNCQIVSLSWLLESVQAKKPLPESNFAFGNGSTSQADTKSQNGNDDTEVKPKTKKRSASKDEAPESIKKSKNSQKATTKCLNIPIDEGFNMRSGTFRQPTVFIDDAGLIWDATLNQTVASDNANKFYRIQLLAGTNGTFMTWTRWGRVGENGQSANQTYSNVRDAMALFERKFKDKSGLAWANRLDTPKNKKYTFLERNYEEDDESSDDKPEKKVKKEENVPAAESLMSKPLQDLMSFIFNLDHVLEALASMSYDVHKLPLGKLSDRTLKSGFSVLKELSEVITDPASAPAKYGTAYGPTIEHLTNRYYTLIPHVFGRNRPPILGTDAQIKKEVELLEALTDMDVANEIMTESKDDTQIHELDRQFQGLGMKEMVELDHSSTEFEELESYLQTSRGSTHNMNYKVVNIFRIERQGETERFNSSKYAKIKNGDRRLLWHGSRSTNFGGILSQGLRIAPPEAPVNGYMFGKGVYLADTSSKSANYCCPYNSGGMGLLLLCDAELGSPMLELERSNYNAGEDALKEGKIATLGKGHHVPGGWKDAGCVNPNLAGVKMPDVAIKNPAHNNGGLFYNEYIVYDVAQIRQRYLFQVKMN